MSKLVPSIKICPCIIKEFFKQMFPYTIYSYDSRTVFGNN